MEDKELKKTAALTDKDRSKVKKYWNSLLGKSYSADQVKDYKPKGDSKEVTANKNQ